MKAPEALKSAAVRGHDRCRLRYLEAWAKFGLTAREQLTSGCHVHVAVADDDEGVAAMDRIGPWLSVLLAQSANSPYWGPARAFGTAGAYHEVVDTLVSTGTILDQDVVYFDARLSTRYPTVEIRIADVCLDADTVTNCCAPPRGARAAQASRTTCSRRSPGGPCPRTTSSGGSSRT